MTDRVKGKKVQNSRKEDKKARLPAWLSAILWSIYGVLWAVLTICILSASLLLLIRWAFSTSLPTGPTVTVTRVADSSAGGTLTAESATAGDISTPLQGGTSGDTVTGGGTALSTLTPSPSPGSSGTSETLTGPTIGVTQEQAGSSVTPTAVSSTEAATDTSSTVTGVASGTPGTPTSTSTSTVTPSATPSPTATVTPTATPTPIPPSPQEYIVQRDDWLSKLSDKFYGDILAYPAIVKATNAKAKQDDSFTFIEDPDFIEVGQKLWIPTAEEAAALLAEEE